MSHEVIKGYNPYKMPQSYAAYGVQKLLQRMDDIERQLNRIEANLERVFGPQVVQLSEPQSVGTEAGK